MTLQDHMADVLHRDILAHPEKYSEELAVQTIYFSHACEKSYDSDYYIWPMSRASWLRTLAKELPGNCTENE